MPYIYIQYKTSTDCMSDVRSTFTFSLSHLTSLMPVSHLSRPLKRDLDRVVQTLLLISLTVDACVVTSCDASQTTIVSSLVVSHRLRRDVV